MTRSLAVFIGIAGVLACSTHRPGADRDVAPRSAMPGGPLEVLSRLASEGDDPQGLVQAVLALRDPEIALVGSVPVTLTRSDGSLPDYPLHPQGLAWLPETRQWAISAAEIIRERETAPNAEGDRNGEGRPYVFFTDAAGRIDSARTTELPARAGAFHPGGIDNAGGSIFLSLSPYVPDSHAEILRLPNAPLAVPVTIGAVPDHIGLVTVSSGAGPKPLTVLRAASWDARRWYTIGLDGSVSWTGENPLPIAFQDGQGLPGTEYVLWSGVVNPGATAFGFALIRLRGEKMEPTRSIVWKSDPFLSEQGHPPFQNATFFWIDPAHRIWVLAMPDDQHGRWRPRPHRKREGADSGDIEDPQAGRGAALRLYRVFSRNAAR